MGPKALLKSSEGTKMIFINSKKIIKRMAAKLVMYKNSTGQQETNTLKPLC
jgi:hypothetical protein